MTTVGAERQEKKLVKLAQIAKELSPEINELSVKGALRFGAKAAIEKSGFEEWSDLVDQPASVKRIFFDTLIEESKHHLKSTIPENLLDDFVKRVKEENEKMISI